VEVDAFLRLRLDVIEWREVEGEVVALDLRTSVYVAVNRSGALLWPALAKGTTRTALVETLVGSYGLRREAATADVDAFLSTLDEQDLLESGDLRDVR
jgi:hypothetical protein